MHAATAIKKENNFSKRSEQKTISDKSEKSKKTVSQRLLLAL